MALFMDGNTSTLEDLRAYENAVFDVANTERIDLSQKQLLAQEELETELNSILSQLATQTTLDQVTVTKPLRQWHVFRSLALVYRDAYNSHFNDRYQGKWKEYERLASWALRKLMETGVGIVQTPIAKAEAPVVGATAGTLPAGTYWVRVSWIGPAGMEGCASDPANLAVAEGSGFRVEARNPPENASGWNVYVGRSPTDTRRQNDNPLDPGAIWEKSDSTLADGVVPGDGQTADVFVTQRRILQRG